MLKPNSYKLISEQYDVVLLKENAPEMTITSLYGKIDRMNLSEAQWTAEFSDRILNEFFGAGAKAVGRGIGSALGSAAKKAGSALKDKAVGAAQAGTDAVKGVAQAGADKVKDVAGAVKDRAENFVDDAKEVHKQGSYEAQLNKSRTQAEKSVADLMNVLQMAQDEYGLTFSGPVDQLPLGDVVSELVTAAQGASNMKQSATKQLGKFGGR